MSLPLCQEFFSHIPNNFPCPSAPLRPPFFRVCQVFFYFCCSNFVFKIIQARFLGLCQEFFSHIPKNFPCPSARLKPPFFRFFLLFFHLSSSNFVFKIIQAPFSGFCQEIFSHKQQQKQPFCSKLFCALFRALSSIIFTKAAANTQNGKPFLVGRNSSCYTQSIGV